MYIRGNEHNVHEQIQAMITTGHVLSTVRIYESKRMKALECYWQCHLRRQSRAEDVDQIANVRYRHSSQQLNTAAFL